LAGTRRRLACAANASRGTAPIPMIHADATFVIVRQYVRGPDHTRTGFFVSASGHFLTAAHIFEYDSCSRRLSPSAACNPAYDPVKSGDFEQSFAYVVENARECILWG